jgi:hypothetical protein
MGLHHGLAMRNKPAAATEMTHRHYDMLKLKKLTENFSLVITTICYFFHVLNCLELEYLGDSTDMFVSLNASVVALR